MNPANIIRVPPLIKLSEQERASLTAPHSMGLDGARCDVTIELTERYRNLNEVVGLPRVESLQGKALVDTGAIATSIDRKAAQRLYLEVVGRAQVRTVFKGRVFAPMYSFTMMFSGYCFVFQNAPGADLEEFGLLAIIGRDVLLPGVLEYSGVNGDCSFTIPGLSPSQK